VPNLSVDEVPAFYDLAENNCHYEMVEVKDPLFVWDFLTLQDMAKHAAEHKIDTIGWKISSKHSRGKSFAILKPVRNTKYSGKETDQDTRIKICEAMDNFDINLATTFLQYNLQLFIMPYDFEKFWHLIRTRVNPPPQAQGNT
jgi:hypothetical protein